MGDKTENTVTTTQHTSSKEPSKHHSDKHHKKTSSEHSHKDKKEKKHKKHHHKEKHDHKDKHSEKKLKRIDSVLPPTSTSSKPPTASKLDKPFANFLPSGQLFLKATRGINGLLLDTSNKLGQGINKLAQREIMPQSHSDSGKKPKL